MIKCSLNHQPPVLSLMTDLEAKVLVIIYCHTCTADFPLSVSVNKVENDRLTKSTFSFLVPGVSDLFLWRAKHKNSLCFTSHIVCITTNQLCNHSAAWKQSQARGKWMGLCSNKTLFIKTGTWLNLGCSWLYAISVDALGMWPLL